MERRCVVLLVVTALLVYLVMPDPSAPAVGSTAQAAAELSHDSPGQPSLTSDGVTLLNRDATTPQPQQSALEPPPTEPMIIADRFGAALPRSPGGHRSTTSFLQVLRR